MTGSVALDVFIGLISIYLTYSLFASILMEAIAKRMSLRADNTLRAMLKLLDDSDYSDSISIVRFFTSVFAIPGRFKDEFRGSMLTALFYAHPNIKNLGKNDLSRKPATISAELFTDTLIQILRGDQFTGQQNQIAMIKSNMHIGDSNEGRIKLPVWYSNSTYKPGVVEGNKASKKNAVGSDDGLSINPLTVYQLKQFLFDSNADVDVLKVKLQAWFNEMMERSSGWYVKQTRGILFIIGLLIAIVFGVDSIQIVKKLSVDQKTRDKMIEFAAVLQKQEAPDTTMEKDAKEALEVSMKSIREASTIMGAMPYKHPMSILGYLITAFAISLGAPFWFDLLGKIMAVRQAGKPREGEAKKSDNSDQPAVG